MIFSLNQVKVTSASNGPHRNCCAALVPSLKLLCRIGTVTDHGVQLAVKVETDVDTEQASGLLTAVQAWWAPCLQGALSIESAAETFLLVASSSANLDLRVKLQYSAQICTIGS